MFGISESGRFTQVLLYSYLCVGFVLYVCVLMHFSLDAIGWSLVCVCKISCSYRLVFFLCEND